MTASHSRLCAGSSSELDGGAYPLSTFDIVAIGALIYVASALVRYARAPPKPVRASQTKSQ